MAEATLKQMYQFFGYDSLGEFSKDYKQLSEADRQQLKQGIGDGSLTY